MKEPLNVDDPGRVTVFELKPVNSEEPVMVILLTGKLERVIVFKLL
jgi:hypothetical protein